jgi:hypothetical protein
MLASARAQKQEQKLVDRLLRPDTTLANVAQKKKFVVDGASVDKQATVVKPFYFENKEKPQSFAGAREYHATGFDSRPFYAGLDHQSVATQVASTSQATYRTWVASASRSHDSDKAAATYRYTGQRPFLDHGKSEKSLQRQNPPMTVEQVRELLNKNR